MERSPNMNLLPMKGTIERETKRKAIEARATRLVIQGLVQPEPVETYVQPELDLEYDQ